MDTYLITDYQIPIRFNALAVTPARWCDRCLHLAVPHSLVMVTVGDEHVEQGALQTCFRLEEDVVRKGPMNV